MLLQVSQFFPLCPPPPSTPHSLQRSPPWFMPMGHAYKFFGSVSYTVTDSWFGHMPGLQARSLGQDVGEGCVRGNQWRCFSY